MYTLVFYTNVQDDSPIDDFLDSLDKKSRAKVAAHLSLLEEHGPHLRRPYADSVRGKIRELRIQQSSYISKQIKRGGYERLGVQSSL